ARYGMTGNLSSAQWPSICLARYTTTACNAASSLQCPNLLLPPPDGHLADLVAEPHPGGAPPVSSVLLRCHTNDRTSQEREGPIRSGSGAGRRRCHPYAKSLIAHQSRGLVR